MIRKLKENNPEVIREGGRKIDLLDNHGSGRKCIVRIEKLQPQQLMKNFKIVVQKLDINTILDQQEDITINRKRLCKSSCKTFQIWSFLTPFILQLLVEYTLKLITQERI